MPTPKTNAEQVKALTAVLEDWMSEEGQTDATMTAVAITMHGSAVMILAEQQARTADALELANLIQARALGAFDTAEEYKATRDKIRALAGLPESNIA